MNLTGKVALVTGGASGIGAACVEEFLKNNVKGVILADIADGKQIAKDFGNKYGFDRVIYVKTDISKRDSFEDAFREAVKKYNNIDILVNCAGICNEIEWEREIQVNLIGTTHGCLLAINQYFPKHKSADQAYIINIASVAGVIPLACCPHYTSTKHGIIGLTRSFGINKEINSQGIYIMALCPGATVTPMTQKPVVVYNEILVEEFVHFPIQEPQAVAESVTKLLQKTDNGSVWIISEGVLSKSDLPLWNNMKEMLIEA